MYFGKNLRYLRKLKAWSQEQVADKLGYKSFTTIQKWESGDSEPPMNKLRSVCLLFNIPMDLILNYDLEKSASRILKKVRELKYDYNLPSDSLTEQLDIANISYDEWISGESQSYMFYLSELASIFDVSTDFLMGKTKLFRSIDDSESIEISVALGDKSISTSEVEHIKKYRDLDDFGRKTVDIVLDRETERVEQIRTLQELQGAKPNFRVIQYYQKLASAGTGQVIFGDVPVDRIEIPDIPEYKRVSYAIGVNGNSMEPLFYDGDMLLIEPTCEIEVGEIGIFIVGNEAFVKKLGENELISLNKGYGNIPLTEDSKCMGRVVGKV